jgi:glycosyltransferase involved in cell wall biosynthesis
MIALLGKRDEPTDGIRDYCGHLSAALAFHNIYLEVVPLSWERDGWAGSLRQLRQRSRAWRGEWVLLQYTGLAWSRRGFPRYISRILRILRGNGAHCGVVFHESMPAAGSRFQDVLRAKFQRMIMRRAFNISERSVFTVPLERVSWLTSDTSKAVCVPLGPPIPPSFALRELSPEGSLRRVGVFCITGGNHTARETLDIATAVRAVRKRIGPVSLTVLGRGVDEARSGLEKELAGSTEELKISGILPEAVVTEKLASCDVILYVRGEISPQRSSGLVGVACGLPIVAYRGPGTVFPITEAGIEFAPLWDRNALADALCHVLQDRQRWQELRDKSRRAYTKYFSWDHIAEQFAASFPLQENSSREGYGSR